MLYVIQTIGTEAYSDPIDQIERVVTTALNDYAMIGPNTSDSKVTRCTINIQTMYLYCTLILVIHVAIYRL